MQEWQETVAMRPDPQMQGAGFVPYGQRPDLTLAGPYHTEGEQTNPYAMERMEYSMRRVRVCGSLSWASCASPCYEIVVIQYLQ